MLITKTSSIYKEALEYLKENKVMRTKDLYKEFPYLYSRTFSKLLDLLCKEDGYSYKWSDKLGCEVIFKDVSIISGKRNTTFKSKPIYKQEPETQVEEDISEQPTFKPQLNEFDRKYNTALEFVRKQGKCNRTMLRRVLYKSDDFCDSIIKKLQDECIVSDEKQGRYYIIIENED